VTEWQEIGVWLESVFGPGGLALCALSAALAFTCNRLWSKLSEVQEARLREATGTLKTMHEAASAQRELAQAIEKIGGQVEALTWERRR